MLVASDGNNQIVPLAVAIVRSESDNSWQYFFQHAVRHMPRLNSSDMVIVSDRCKGLENGVSSNCPDAHHVFCSAHLARNVCQRCDAGAREEIKNLVLQAAKTPRKDEFERLLANIKDLSEPASNYLASLDPKVWAQSASNVPRFYVTTSNHVESLNALLVEPRKRGPLALLIELQRWTFKTFGERAALTAAALQRGEAWTSKMQQHLNEETEKGRHYRCVFNGLDVSVTVANGLMFAVDLCLPPSSPCSCGVWSAARLPCSHLLAALGSHKPLPIDFASWIPAFWGNAELAALYQLRLPAVDTEGLAVDEQLTVVGFEKTRRRQRLPSLGEDKTTAQRHRQPHTLAGVTVGSSSAREQRAAAIASNPGAVIAVGNGHVLVSAAKVHFVTPSTQTCDCPPSNRGVACPHLIAATSSAAATSQQPEVIQTTTLLSALAQKPTATL